MKTVILRKPVGLLVATALLLANGLAGIGVADKNKASVVVKKSSAKKIKPKTARNTVFSDYRRWHSVNQKAFWVPGRVAAMCAAPLPKQIAPSPHDGKFVRVYINSIARDAMLKMKNPQFAHGSIIVKEKLATENSNAAELLTVMAKREKGFDAPNGDWEYLVLNGSGTHIQQRGKLSNCQSCHTPQKETDYVFRTYLSVEAQRQLR